MPSTAAEFWTRLADLPRPTLGELFADGGETRVAALSARLELGEGRGGMLLDWSKTHLDAAVIAAFEELAATMNFAGMRSKLFAGEIVNPTEGRAADHATLRGVGDSAKVEEAAALIDRMGMLVEAIHGGAFGEIAHLIHIGIGGSALGPALCVDALGRDLPLVDVHVVSNIDGVALEEAFSRRPLPPVISSSTLPSR